MAAACQIVLCGLPSSGKSTTGRLVASRLGRPFVDSDDVVVEQAGCEIVELFSTRGEAAFRDLEAAVVADLLAGPPRVIALGGGAVLRPETHTALAAHRVVWLRAGVAALVERLHEAEAASRPLVAGDVGERLTVLERERRDLYATVASVVVDVDDLTPEEAADVVVARLGEVPA